MKLEVFLVCLIVLALATVVPGASLATRLSSELTTATGQGNQTDEHQYVYADFEQQENGRVVSNGGGLIQIYTGQDTTPVNFKGLVDASPGAPELVREKHDDKNHLASFEYSLTGPNQWANVTMEVQGHPNKDGQPVADDVSSFKKLSVQLYATGVDFLRVEFLSHGQGIKLDGGFPQISVRLRPGFNTYLIPLKGLQQPSWVETRVDSKDVLRKLTAISISAYCNQCTPQHGTVVVDNLVFQK